jgi:hypothetical protein
MSAIDILTETGLSLVKQLELLRLFIVFKKLFPNMPFDSFVKSAVFDENGSALYSAALRTKNVWGQREINTETKVTLLSYYADMLDDNVELSLTEYLTEVFESDAAGECSADPPDFDDIRNFPPETLLAPVETPEDSDHLVLLESVAQTVTQSDMDTALALLSDAEPVSVPGASLLRLAHAEFTHENGTLDFVVEISTAENYHYVDAYLLAGGEDVVAEHPPIRDMDFVGQDGSDDCTPLTIRYDDKDYSLTLSEAASDEVAPV